MLQTTEAVLQAGPCLRRSDKGHFGGRLKKSFRRLHAYSCLSILAKANMHQTTEAVLQAGVLPAQERRKGHFAKVAGRLKRVSDGLRAMRTITLR